MSVFNIAAYKYFGKRDYVSLTENSQKIIEHCTQLINEKYNKQYDAKQSHGIEYDGSCDWIYVGFYEPSNDSDELGYVWYLVYSNSYKTPVGIQSYDYIIEDYNDKYVLDVHDKGVAINEDKNYIENHVFEIMSMNDFYTNQLN